MRGGDDGRPDLSPDAVNQHRHAAAGRPATGTRPSRGPPPASAAAG